MGKEGDNSIFDKRLEKTENTDKKTEKLENIEKKVDKAEKLENFEKKIEKTLQVSEISLVLDTYDDIFSDFDPRPFAERALSVDFLEEAERASKDKPSGDLDLNLLIPQNLRDSGKELTIKKRLKDHFKKHHQQYSKEKRTIVKSGLSLTLGGMIFMFLAAFVAHKNLDSILASFLIILFEPASWFMFWEGLNQVIFESKRIGPKIDFYGKMAKCNVNFFNY